MIRTTLPPVMKPEFADRLRCPACHKDHALTLDPRSADGFVAWNILDEALESTARYPLLRAAGPLPPGSYREEVTAPATPSGR